MRTGEGAGAGCRSGTADCRHRHRHRLKGTAGWSRRNSETADLRTPPTLPRTCKIDFHLDVQLVLHLLVSMSPSMSTGRSCAPGKAFPSDAKLISTSWVAGQREGEGLPDDLKMMVVLMTTVMMLMILVMMKMNKPGTTEDKIL